LQTATLTAVFATTVTLLFPSVYQLSSASDCSLIYLNENEKSKMLVFSESALLD